jgi:hypothetical protein
VSCLAIARGRRSRPAVISLEPLRWRLPAPTSSRKSVPPSRSLEAAGRSVRRAPEGAPVVAGELRRGERRGSCGTSHTDDGVSRARRSSVDRAGDELLARTGFPGDKNERRGSISERADEPARLPDRDIVVDDRDESLFRDLRVGGHRGSSARISSWPREPRARTSF